MQKKNTFGDDLEHFVLSIDIVDNDVKDDVLDMIKGYLKKALSIHLVVFHVESRVNDDVGLQTTDWLPTPQKLSTNIRNSDNTFTTQVALAYDKESSLWIHGTNSDSLSNEDKYVDSWSNIESDLIPKYVKKTSDKTLTSIIIPTKNPQLSRVIGVINFESDWLIEYTQPIKDELEKIANSIVTLYLLNGTFITQRDNTKREINYLRSRCEQDINLRNMISKPKVFVACSARAEEDVIGQVTNILDGFYNQGLLEYTNWKDMAQPGVIVHQIAEEINNCLFGICYFSDPASTGEEKTYIDNPNVLFESGLVSAKGEAFAFESLIPIREKSGDLPPFDLAGIRLLEVPRNENGKLNTNLFADELKKRIQTLLTSSGIM